MAEGLHSNEFWKKKAYRAIQVRDTNKDGCISKADFDLVVERYREMGVSEKHLQKLEDHFAKKCAKFGMVGGASLTYEQFASEHAKTAKDKDRARFFDVMFDIIDTNENGVISYEEWVQYYKAVGIDTKYARASFDAMDANGDGVISKEEFTAYIVEYMFTAEDKLHSSILYGPLD